MTSPVNVVSKNCLNDSLFFLTEKSRENVLSCQTGSVFVVLPYFLGDTVLSSTLLQSLQRQLSPKTALYVTGSPCQLNLVETLPEINHAFIAPENINKKIELLKSLKSNVVFLLRYSLEWGLAIKKANVPYRIGFDLERIGISALKKWGGLLTHSVNSGWLDYPLHQTDLYRIMLEHVGLKWFDNAFPTIKLMPEDYQQAESALENLNKYRFVLHITAGSPGKHWPFSHWVELIKRLDTTYYVNWIAVGASADFIQYEYLSEAASVPIYNLCGKTTLRESAAICQLSDLIITIDTALAHIAAAVEVSRLVILYGPTNFNQWTPLIKGKTKMKQVFMPISCRPCIARTCYHRSCMKYLAPDRVFNHIQKLMS